MQIRLDICSAFLPDRKQKLLFDFYENQNLLLGSEYILIYIDDDKTKACKNYLLSVKDTYNCVVITVIYRFQKNFTRAIYNTTEGIIQMTALNMSGLVD